MARALWTIPVRMRVGDLPEYEVGSISPDIRLAPDMVRGLAAAHVDVAGPLADLLRAMADALSQHGDDSPVSR